MKTANRFAFIEYLSPTALALLSVELLDARDSGWLSGQPQDSLLEAVDCALDCNVGPEEAEQLRIWCRQNI